MSSQAPKQFPSATGSGRLLPDSWGFWLSGPLLVFAVAGEAIYGFFAALAFVFTRRRRRERLRALLYGARGVLLAVAVASVSVGCVTTGHPGSSFGDQVDNLAWSVEVLTEDDWTLQELRTDLYRWIVEDFTVGGGDFVESFEMLGW